MVYLLCFIWTPFFTYLAEKQFDNKKKNLGIFLSFLAIFLPSLIAGFRSLDVGRDVGAYVTPAIKNALSMNFLDYMKSPINVDGYLETGYRLLIYVFAHISSSPNFSMFMLQFLTILCVFIFAYKSKDKTDMTFVMAIYMIMWYCKSLTYMRQSLSIGIILLSVLCFERKKYLKTLLLFVLAISFHKVAIVSILIYFFMWFTEKEMLPKRKFMLYFLIIISLLIGTLFFEQITYLFTKLIPILPHKYYDYTQSYLSTAEDNSLLELLLNIFWIGLSLMYKKCANKKESKVCINLIILLLLVNFSTLLLSYKIVNIARIGLYFYYLALFYLIPNVNKIFKSIGRVRFLVSFTCVVIMLIFWIWDFPVHHWSETYPYRSDIIKFLK